MSWNPKRVIVPKHQMNRLVMCVFSMHDRHSITAVLSFGQETMTLMCRFILIREHFVEILKRYTLDYFIELN